MFSAVLCERHASLDLEAMQELAIVTAVIGQAAIEGNYSLSLSWLSLEGSNRGLWWLRDKPKKC